MGTTHPSIDNGLRAFIEAQHLFFVATAPSGDEGHINVSPKGMDSLRVLDSHTIAYLDFVGSGVETIAHVRQNARMCLMFCAFHGPPRIVRLHGAGEVLEPQDAGFGEMRRQFTQTGAVRSVIVVRVTRVSDSCGYAVPRFTYSGERARLTAWAERKGPEGLLAYQREKNARSIDGIPGLRWPAEEPE